MRQSHERAHTGVRAAGARVNPFVVFDLDDTLVDYDGAILRGLGEFAQARGLGDEGLAFLFEIDAQPLSVGETWRMIRERFDLSERAEALEAEFAATLPSLTFPMDGAVEGLMALRAAGWRTGLLTNGVVEDQRAKLRDGMADLFDAVLVCDGSGPRKPEPAAFVEVARLAGAELSGAWMVGDSLSADIAGGAGVGMATIWVSQGRERPAVSPEPDHTVTDIGEAFSLLLDHVRTQRPG